MSEHNHSTMKHIELREHHIRELTDSDKITSIYVPTEHNLADIFTKPLDKLKFQEIRKKLLVISRDEHHVRGGELEHRS